MHRAQSEMPLRIGSPARVAVVREFLQGSGFAEAQVCSALKLQTLSALGTLKETEIDLSKLPSPLAIFIRLFVLLQLVPKRCFEEAVPGPIVNHLKDLDLIRELDPENYYASVFLYPVSGFIVASDRHSNADGSPFDPPPDVVFPAIFPGTLRFLRLVPKSPVEEALDLCAGSGIGALILSHSAGHVIASDITARAAHFARFNQLLNERRNVESVQGDLYEPIAGRTFDRITAHPPYVPSLGDEMVFRDGGQTGETVLRRAVEGLPAYLRPGGTFTALCIGLDTKTAPFENRVRGWLGDQERKFDVVFACGSEKSPEEALKDIEVRAANISTFRPHELSRHFETVSKVNYGALFIRHRKSAANPALTLRPKLSVHTDGDGLEWLFGWHDRREAIAKTIVASRPRLAPGLLIKSTHGVSRKGLVPIEFFLETDRPFAAVTRFDDPWVVPLIAQFDGSRSVAELHRAAGAANEIPDNFKADDLAKLVLMLAERGCVELPEWPLPPHSSH